MEWTQHGERELYHSHWLALTLVDVELPNGRRFEHEVIRFERAASATLVHDVRADAVLMIYRHRFITDEWAWELPAGVTDPGETPAETAVRETLEETGWEPGPVRHLVTSTPTSGASDQRFHTFYADEFCHRGEPSDVTEASKVDWVAVQSVPELVSTGELVDGLAIMSLSFLAAFGPPEAS